MKPTRTVPALVLLAIATLAPVALAEEIVYFRNGTSLPIRSHEVDGSMIRVDLGENAFMAFPASQIDRIEQAGAGVIIRRSSTASNRVAPSPEGSFPVSGSGRGRGAERPAPSGAPRAAGSRIEEGENGTVYERPFAGAAHPGLSNLRVTGSAAARAARDAGGRLNGRAAAGSNRVRLPSHRSRQVERDVHPVPFAFAPKNRTDPGGQAAEGADTTDAGSGGGGDSGADQ